MTACSRTVVFKLDQAPPSPPPDAVSDEPSIQGGSPAKSMAVPLVLQGHQRALFEVLQHRDGSPAAMYLGALHVLAEEGNPDRLALAAHGIRELIEKLPKYFDLPVPTQARMGDKVAVLQAEWKKVRPKMERGGPFPTTLWDKLEEFFLWLESDRPAWRAKVAQLLRSLDPAGRPLPAPIEKLRVQQWLECNEFFVNSSHHRECTQDEFMAWLDFLERFLLDLVRPRTFDNADKLDALILEGEDDA